MFNSLLSELSADVTSGRIISAFSTGVIASIIFIIYELSYAAMIYSGGLSSLATRGAGLTLFGGFLICLTVALTSSCKFTVANPQDAPVAVLSTIAITMSATMGSATSMEVQFITVAALLSLSSLLTAAAFIVVGRLQLANMLRFVPFPVVGGFLAGTGWLLVVGGIAVMCGLRLSPATLSRLLSPDMVLKWLPGVVFGLILFVVKLRYTHFLIVPGSLVAGVALFYVALAICDITPDAARGAGFLVSGVPADGFWPPFTQKDLTLIDWPTVWRQFPSIFSVVLISVIGMLLNVSGIELAAGKEIDLNREFVIGGAGNCLVALVGCSPGYPSISLSLLGLKTGVQSRLTGIVTALIVGAVLFAGGGLLEYFPRALLGGMLLLSGFSLIHEWIFNGRKRMPLPDYLILFAIFLVIGLFGFLHGVALGLVAAVLFFVIRFSAVPVIRNEFNALDQRSIKIRPVPHRMLLSITGERIRGYELTGYIFFGSATTLISSLNNVLSLQPHPDVILLDFANVSGFDISAVNNFQRFAFNADAGNTTVVVTAAPDRLTEALKCNLSQKVIENMAFFHDLDQGLEWSEDRLIDRTISNSTDDASIRDKLFHHSLDNLMTHLDQQERFESLIERLSGWLELRESPIGSIILNKGEQSSGLYLLTRGMATEIDHDSGLRLRSLTPGSIITAAAAFDSYTALTTFRADSACELAILSPVAHNLLEREDPKLANILHVFLIQRCSRL